MITHESEISSVKNPEYQTNHTKQQKPPPQLPQNKAIWQPKQTSQIQTSQQLSSDGTLK